MDDAYDRLCVVLDAAAVSYRVLEHPAEGRTDQVSALRGHPVNQAAKSIILMIKFGKKTTRFALAVLRGDGRLDFSKIKALLAASDVRFAPPEVAERLACSPLGTVLPFPMSGELTLLADPELLKEEIFYFNAGRFDRSIALRSADFVALAQPRVAAIARYGG